jgi:UDP-2,3-diacylglucosamine pyrophosphatase LpxH
MAGLHYKTLFISDTHLGLRSAKSEYLLDFLRHTECDNLYLVGDIIDGWKMNSGWYWPAINNEIVRLVMKKAARGTRVIYVPGNHDEALREHLDINVAGIEVMGEAVHESGDGRRFLVMHGDEFDCVVMNNKWLAHLGNWAYDVLLWLNRWFNVARRKLGFGYWSLSAYLKNQVKEAVKYIGNFEDAVIRAGRERGMDGVICGHIHHAVITDFDGMLYANCGDWVESCTALAEESDGSLHLIRWVDESAGLLDHEKEKTYADSDTDGRLVSPG